MSAFLFPPLSKYPDFAQGRNQPERWRGRDFNILSELKVYTIVT